MNVDILQNRSRKLGSFLVVLQFGILLFLAYLAMTSMQVPRGLMPFEALLLIGASVMLAAWALMHNRPGNFNINSRPRIWCVVVFTGPYQWIRHPMYTSLLLGASALALISNPFFGWATWHVLALTLVLTSQLEERLLVEKYPEYSYYAKLRKRFIPWLF